MNDAINAIEGAISDTQQAMKVSPPCPVFTARAIARYDEAIASLEKKRAKLQEILNNETHSS